MFVHNQLFEQLRFPARFCPSPFHMTFARNGQFRNESAMQEYFRPGTRWDHSHVFQLTDNY